MNETPAEARAREHFTQQTAQHQLTVLHDEGLYRHLRMARPGTRAYSWDVVTWPGHLSITGDIGDGFVFTRLADMLDFFRPLGAAPGDTGPLRINPGYWHEKMPQHQRTAALVHSRQTFLDQVREAAIEQYEPTIDPADQIPGYEDMDYQAQVAAEQELIDRLAAKHAEGVVNQALLYAEDENSAYRWLRDNEDLVGGDTWEWDFTEFDHQYLLACFAIAATVRAWDDAAPRGLCGDKKDHPPHWHAAPVSGHRDYWCLADYTLRLPDRLRATHPELF